MEELSDLDLEFLENINESMGVNYIINKMLEEIGPSLLHLARTAYMAQIEGNNDAGERLMKDLSRLRDSGVSTEYLLGALLMLSEVISGLPDGYGYGSDS